jgi:hypothetical protein
MTTPLTDQVQQTGEGSRPVKPGTNVVILDPTNEVKIHTERDSEGIPFKTQLFIAYDEVVIANDQKSEPMDGLLVEECDFEATTIEVTAGKHPKREACAKATDRARDPRPVKKARTSHPVVKQHPLFEVG